MAFKRYYFWYRRSDGKLQQSGSGDGYGTIKALQNDNQTQIEICEEKHSDYVIIEAKPVEGNY